MKSYKKVISVMLALCMALALLPVNAWAADTVNTLTIDGAFHYKDVDGQCKPIPYADIKMTHSTEGAVFGGTITDGVLTIDLDSGSSPSMVYGTYYMLIGGHGSRSFLSWSGDIDSIEFKEGESVGEIDVSLEVSISITPLNEATEEPVGDFLWELQKNGTTMECGTGTCEFESILSENDYITQTSITFPWDNYQLRIQKPGYVDAFYDLQPSFNGAGEVCLSSLASPQIWMALSGGDLGTGVSWRVEDDSLIFSGIGAIPDYYSHLDLPWKLLITGSVSVSPRIRNIIIEPGISRIGDRAFSAYYSPDETSELTISIPDTVTTIGEVALGFTELREITIPSSVKTIERAAFDCSENMTVTFLGDAPEFEVEGYHDGTEQVFWRSSGIVIRYPSNNQTWDPWIGNNLSAEDSITWLPYGGSDDEGPKSYTVTFDSQGGSSLSSISVPDKEKIDKPTAPVKSGHTFDGWYKDASCTIPWDFEEDTVTSDMTLYAKWTYSGGGSSSGGPSSGGPSSGGSSSGGSSSGGSSSGGSSSGGSSSGGSSSGGSSENNIEIITIGSQNIPVTVNDGTAEVAATEAEIAAMIAGSAADGIVSIDVSVLENVSGPTLQQNVVSAINQSKEVSGLSIEMKSGSINLSSDALDVVSNALASSNDTVTFKIDMLDVSTVLAAQKYPIDNILKRAVLVGPSALIVHKDNRGKVTSTEQIREFNGTVAVSVPFARPANMEGRQIVAFGIASDGTITYLPVRYENGTATFTTTHFSTFGIMTSLAAAFRDVDITAWYMTSVECILDAGIMSGYSNGTFDPNNNLSRAQLVQILYNIEGRPGTGSGTVFTDVSVDGWYSDAVSWATGKGIVSGYGNGTFGPNDPITREQLAVMLWRYAGSPAAATGELYFNDVDEVGSYALGALRWAVGNGILNGYGDGRLAPKGQATRAQAAQMLQNYLGQ